MTDYERQWTLAQQRRNRIARGQPEIRICAKCPNPSTSSRHVLCGPCRAQSHAKRRFTSSQKKNLQSPAERGYGAEHRAARKRWAPKVDAGAIVCGFCHRPIEPGTAWDLSHPEDDKSQAPVPWHRKCNRRYAATVTLVAANAARRAARR